MFGLPVYRHRLFEASLPLEAPRGCDHRQPAMNPHNQLGRDRIYEAFGRQNPDPIWNSAMGVGWMDKEEGREAIPPAYTAYLGRFLLIAVLANRREAERAAA
jgi:DNA (cytosine-5)-methyltransferase 1